MFKFSWFHMISVQKRPFCDSALWHLQLHSLETKFCCSATTASEFLECTGEISATLLPQWQNVSHLRNILLFCYSATPVAECFLPEKYSAILLPCYPSGGMFLTREIFCYPATLLPQWQNVSYLRNILLLCYSQAVAPGATAIR